MKYTLREWVAEWLYTYKRIMVKPSTFDSYLQYSTHVTCDRYIDELQTPDIQHMINQMIVDQKQLSTIKHMLTLIRQSLRKARALGLISSLDCLENLELPRTRPKKVGPLSDDQIQLVLKNAHRSYYGDFYRALLLTGCRVGELIALRWHDVDWFNSCIYIVNTDYNGKLQSVKTEHGSRCLPMSAELCAIFEARYRASRHERVFSNTIGRPIKYRTVLDDWHWFCSHIGLFEPIGFHVLRHTFAHVALRSGVPVKVVSAWLGHADVRITLDIYDSVDRADMRAAADRLAAAFSA